MTLNRLIFRHFLQGALIPILIIEVALIAMYFVISSYTFDSTRREMVASAVEQLERITSLEAQNIDASLRGVTTLGLILQQEHQRFFSDQTACNLPNGEPAFRVHPNGAFYKSEDNHGSTLFYASTTEIGQEELRKARCTEMLDPLFKSVVQQSPLITQAYLNTWDDMNRIFPFIENVPEQYGSSMNMEEFNFYYEADALHNPDRKPVWTDAYLDPAGQGWMLSLIMPIYSGNFLEGVSGLDVTIKAFTDNLLELDLPWEAGIMLVGGEGTILAMDEVSQRVLDLSELMTYRYDAPVEKTILKPNDYNLLTTDNEELKSAFETSLRSEDLVKKVKLNGKAYYVGKSLVPSTGWYILLVVNQDNIYEPIIDLKVYSDRVGYTAIMTVILFYILFMVYLVRRSLVVSADIARPIHILSEKTANTDYDRLDFCEVDSSIDEVNQLGKNYNRMITQLSSHVNAIKASLTELELARDEAEQANIAKSRFLASISHEIRTPMHGIIGMSELLMSTPLDSQQKDYVRKTSNSAQNLLSIINDLLDFSKIESGKIDIKKIPFEIKDTVRAAIDQCQSQAQKNRILLEIKQSARIPEILIGDPVRIRQVITNLLSNAIKFSPPGGKVCIEVELEEETDSEIRLRFSVEDHGVGIAEDQLDTIFDAFRQADSSTTRKYGGTGLGLTICRQLVEMMGGNIWVQSRLGRGSIFEFELNLDKIQSVLSDESNDHKSTSPAEALKGMRVLLVEPNSIYRELIMAWLSSVGILVSALPNGQGALEALANEDFDVVILDED